MTPSFQNTFRDKTVLLTGHTGFKGAWLAIWLCQLGAKVIGYSTAPPTTPSLFEQSGLADKLTADIRGDVRDAAYLQKVMAQYQPEVVLHLAAQPIVLTSYQDPQETFASNAMGTVNLLDAVRLTPAKTPRAVVCITTDKVYDNQEWTWGYRENDRLGGYDPYSASKAMAELAINSYRQSFFNPARYEEHFTAVASARAGNVIGGGDWADFRLIPDCIRAFVAGESVHIRNPSFVRPWQHVLEPLSGYLSLASHLLQPNGTRYGDAWNFGPAEHNPMTAGELVENAIRFWGSGSFTTGGQQKEKETTYLKLNWDKAAVQLGWQPQLTGEQALQQTISWYKAAQQADTDLYQLCCEQIGRLSSL